MTPTINRASQLCDRFKLSHLVLLLSRCQSHRATTALTSVAGQAGTDPVSTPHGSTSLTRGAQKEGLMP